MEFSSYLVFFLNGLTFGMLLFLISSGLSLTFGVLGVLNFAHGTFYMLGAYLAYEGLRLSGSFWLALLVAPLLVAAFGAAIEIVLLRPVYGRPVVYQLLLTFGVILVVIDLVKAIWGMGYYSVPFPLLLTGSVSVLGRGYPKYNLFIIAVSLLIAGGTWLLLHRTRFGTLVRAAASNRKIAQALGVNVPRLFTVVFALGAWLGGLGGALASPLGSLSLDMPVRIIVEAFAVVVIGGLGSWPGALLGSFLIGQLEAFGILLIPRFHMAFIFMLMTVVLIARPRGLLGTPAPTGEGVRREGESVGASVRARPMPLWLGLLALVLSGLPFLLPPFYVLLLTEALIFTLFASSFNLLFGYTGLLSFGHAAYFGIGAYAAGLLLRDVGWSLSVAAPVGMACAALAALLIGYFCVKLDEIYFAMLTLACAQILHSTVWHWNEVTGGSDGLDMIPRPPLRFPGLSIGVGSIQGFYFFTLVIVAFALLVLWVIINSPLGLALKGIRESPVRGEFVGIRVPRYRLVAFVISGAFSGLAGVLFSVFQRAVTPEAVYWTTSADPVLMSLLGGPRVFLGPAVGAAVFLLIKDLISAYTEFWMLSLGGVLILLVLFLPGGLAGFAWRMVSGRAVPSRAEDKAFVSPRAFGERR
ncbi:MAG: ABC transporter permease [Candidatus Rokubacteria bacterium]|nr:ABC transporter permease [Candidatus Rokubacteria bacterium]